VTAVGRDEVLAWLRALRRVYAEHRDWLTQLDAAIGDADHGVNMDRGFAALEAELEKNAPGDLRAALQTAAACLIRTVGGAAGPLYGTFFLRAAAACAGKAALEAPDVVAMFEAGVAGIAQRGKAALGDKTMLDALLPAVEAMRRGLADGGGLGDALAAGALAAEEGMRSTIPMQARKGRASYLGPRSSGHQDPGATSAWLLVRTAAAVWR
jgi:dihydroxyacetone kinase-like protein